MAILVLSSGAEKENDGCKIHHPLWIDHMRYRNRKAVLKEDAATLVILADNPVVFLFNIDNAMTWAGGSTQP